MGCVCCALGWPQTGLCMQFAVDMDGLLTLSFRLLTWDPILFQATCRSLYTATLPMDTWTSWTWWAMAHPWGSLKFVLIFNQTHTLTPRREENQMSGQVTDCFILWWNKGWARKKESAKINPSFIHEKTDSTNSYKNHRPPLDSTII